VTTTPAPPRSMAADVADLLAEIGGGLQKADYQISAISGVLLGHATGFAADRHGMSVEEYMTADDVEPVPCDTAADLLLEQLGRTVGLALDDLSRLRGALGGAPAR